MEWTKTVDEFDADYGIIGNDGFKIYLQISAGGELSYKVRPYS